MAANLTQQQLDAQIAELEAQIDTQFRGWAQDILDGEELAPAPAGDGPGGGDGDGGGTPAGGTRGTKEPKRPELVLGRRKAARAQLAARRDAQGRQEQEELQARTGKSNARGPPATRPARTTRPPARRRLRRLPARTRRSTPPTRPAASCR